jgi:hypothetical protein
MLFLLGLLIAAATAAFTGLAIADNLNGGPSYSVTILGNHIVTLHPLGIFCSGLALALIFGLGAWLAMNGAKLRRRRNRRLVAERDAMADRLAARDRASQDADTQRAAYGTSDGGARIAGADTDTREPVGANGHRRHRVNRRHLFSH